MTEISERYNERANRFAEVIANVPDDAWSNPSPCEGWTAREVVRHIIDNHGLFLGFVGRELGDIPSVDDDPAAAFDATRQIVGNDLADPERAGASYEGQFGQTTFEKSIDGFLNFDLVVHRWDLARATGGDTSMSDEEITSVWKATEKMGDSARSPGVFGPELEPPVGADEQTRLLAFLGRRA